MKDLIVISGVAGMPGSETAPRCLEAGRTVLGCDNFFCGSPAVVEELTKLGLVFFEYDICRADEMDKFFAVAKRLSVGADRRIFINCAAVVHTKHFYQPENTFGVNVLGMRDCFRRCLQAHFHVFLNCSTSEVYSLDSWRPGGVIESSPVLLATAEQSLRTSYAAGKLMTEFFLREAVEKGQIRGCSIRFANVYSPYELHSDHIIPHIIDSIVRNGKLTLLENARTTRRTFLHNVDSCAAVISLMDSDKSLDGSVYNVGTQEEIYIPDLAVRILEFLQRPEVPVYFVGHRDCDPKRRLLNINKIRQATGWAPQITLDEGLKQCILVRQQQAGIN